MGKEDWRSRRAEELFGTGRGPGPHSARDRRAASDDDVLPMAPTVGVSPPRSSTSFDQWAGSAYRAQPATGAEAPAAPLAASASSSCSPRTTQTRPAMSKPIAASPSRRVSPLWALLAIVALIAAGAVGWLARANLGTPVAVPAASVALPALPPLPRTALPTTAIVSPKPEAPTIAAPQAAVRAPTAAQSIVAAQAPVASDDAQSPRAKRSPDVAGVAPELVARHVKAPNLNARRVASERDSERDRLVDERALEKKRASASVAASSQRAAPASRQRNVAARAPAFNCRRARSEVTQAICSDAGLAALDRQLSSRFATLDRSADPATVQRIHQGETAFLNARQTCSDRECIAEAYRLRLRELDEAGN